MTVALLVLSSHLPAMDASILTSAALSAIGLLTVATFVTIWKLRDDVRDLTAVVIHPRTGLTVSVDHLTTAVNGINERVSSLEVWREVQDEGRED